MPYITLANTPMTQVKQDVLDNCKSPVERFVAVMKDEITEDILYDWVGKNNEKAISCPNLYELYKLWCQTNGEKSWSNRARFCVLQIIADIDSRTDGLAYLLIEV